MLPHRKSHKLGLTADELAFYDALTKPQAKDFYENDELITITKELADTLCKNKMIDWQKRESARAKMRMLIKKASEKAQVFTGRYGGRCADRYDSV